MHIFDNKNENEKVMISLGMARHIVIRATNKAIDVGFNLNDIIRQLKGAYLESPRWGHPGAGTIRFVPILKLCEESNIRIY